MECSQRELVFMDWLLRWPQCSVCIESALLRKLLFAVGTVLGLLALKRVAIGVESMWPPPVLRPLLLG